MRRALRWLFNLAAAVSLLGCAGLGALWLSRGATDQPYSALIGPDWVAAAMAIDGQMAIICYQPEQQPEEHALETGLFWLALLSTRKRFGLLLRGDLLVLCVPTWFAWLCAMLLPSLRLLSFAHTYCQGLRRAKRGLCPGCGYDLRGSPGSSCPECGAARSGERAG
jgi:hypothetical protein